MPAGSPFRQVLLKVHSRCNLACDHCYVYESIDQSWRQQPRVMARRTVDTLAARVAEHVRAHRLPWVSVVLHGGEPLLAGVDRLAYVLRTVRAAVPATTEVDFGVQTNGLLLDDAFLDLFAAHRVSVGVSLDGGRDANDLHRRHADGRSSFDGVARALESLRRRPELYSGILATVDLRNDPVRTYEELLRFAPPRLDLLLPHGNWSLLPPGRPADPDTAPYGDWLTAVFDRWYDAPRRETRIRLFESVISLLLGGPTGTESVGLADVDLLTIETDGSIEQGDVLKTTAPGMAATGLHIDRDSFDDALAHPGVRARQGGLEVLSPQCRQCPLVKVCGGGHYAHRYRAGSGFDQPSVFCPDLTRLISHVRARLDADVRALALAPR